MPRKKIKISKKLLYHLYFQKKMSCQAIGKVVGCCRDTVGFRLKEYSFQLRAFGTWQTKYRKQDFSGDEIEKSYLLGFRVGDLEARLPCKNSKIIVVRCHTTQQDQVKVMEQLFQNYGQLVVSKSQSATQQPSIFVNCNLNKSFSFLLIPKPYRVDNWIAKNFNNSVSFMAGYTDAEGNFIVNQGRARFKIDSYDFFVLDWMDKWLRQYGIKSKLKLLASQGTEGYNKGKLSRKDLWRLNINEAYSLLRFCALILPFSKHKKRIRDMTKCLSNIVQRKEDETI